MKKNTFGKRIKELRIELNLNQEQLAKKLNLAISTIGMYERGERQPNFEILESIADFFNVDIDYLLCRSDIRNKYQYEKKIKNTSILNKKSERDLMIEKYQLNDEELAEYDRITKLSLEMNALMFQSNNIELEVEDKEEMDYELSETLKKAFISSLISKRQKEKE